RAGGARVSLPSPAPGGGGGRRTPGSESDTADGIWTVPASRMKAGKEHRVPLAPQALALLGEPGADDALVFPSPVRPDTPLSDVTLGAMLKRMGKGHLMAHTFRRGFRDWANSTRHEGELIEAALAHQHYARGDLFQERRALMAEWTNYLLHSEGNAVPIGRRSAT